MYLVVTAVISLSMELFSRGDEGSYRPKQQAVADIQHQKCEQSAHGHIYLNLPDCCADAILRLLLLESSVTSVTSKSSPILAKYVDAFGHCVTFAY